MNRHTLDIECLSQRQALRRKLALFFWIVQALLISIALAIRLASPSVVLAPLQVLRPGVLTPSNVCVVVNDHLSNISRTPNTELPAIHARVANLGAYLQGVLFRIPPSGDALFTPEFVQNVQTLRDTCDRWKDPQQPAAAADLQVEIIAFRSKFRDLLHRVPKPAPLWYLHLARSSTGFLEGLAAPAVILYRAVSSALTGRLSVKQLVNPADWRRTSPFFVIPLFYGSLLCSYLTAWLALRRRHPLLYAPGLAAVAYSTCHLFYAAASYF